MSAQRRQQGGNFTLGDYNEVSDRIRELREKYPDARLRLADPSVPYRIEEIGQQTFVVVVAACYRTPDDPAPAHGSAWEPFPGKTPYTRDSELQNAETSAWGRAIVAALAADTRKGIASADEVRNRRSADEFGDGMENVHRSKQSATAPPRDPNAASPDQVKMLRARLGEAKEAHGKDKSALLVPKGWTDAGLPASAGQVPKARVDEALALIDKAKESGDFEEVAS